MARSLFLAGMLLAASSAASAADRIVLVAGGPEAGFVEPFAVDFDKQGTMYVVEMVAGERLRSISPKGKIQTLAGVKGKKGNAGDGATGAKVLFNGMHNLAIGPDGIIYLADTWNNRVRKYDPKTGIVSAFAGAGVKGFSGDGGPALKARFGGCYCLCFDAAGKNLFITDLDNKRIRKVEMATGIVSTVAGNGKRGAPKNGGDALTQPLLDPRAHAVDAKGNLYIVERGGHALCVVDSKGKIRTVAGTGKAGRGSGPALAAAMNGPKHLTVDQDGSVLIADTENHRIVRYIPGEEKLVVVAGSGKKGDGGLGGDPLKVQMNRPHGVRVHPKTGEIYIADSSNNRILKIEKGK